MEKKQNLRSNQLPAKALNSESRKSNQDAPGKQQARHSRRREFSSNNSQTQKTDRSYKQPQPRNVDKRNQASRTIATNKFDTDASASSTRLNHSDDDYAEQQISNEFEFELNSVYLPGSKKQNLNHLLNFNYAPRDRMDSETYMRTGNISKGHNGYIKRIKYNKEQFVQANCQFVVSSAGDYKPYAISPDLLVDWSNVEQVNCFGGNEEPQCPICLYHPVAAKMTRCGHVYCWPCILHYLALSDKKSWRKCPICYEAVHIGDLKSAVSKSHHYFSCDEMVTFQLMYRDKGSLQVKMAKCDDDTINNQSQFPFMSDDDERKLNSKLVLARTKEILSIIERERNELKCQLVSDGIDCADSIFVQQALDLLLEREKSIRTNDSNGTNDANNSNSNETASRKIVDNNNLMYSLSNMNLNADAMAFVPSTIKDCEPKQESQIDLDPSNQLNESSEIGASSLIVPNVGTTIDATNFRSSNPDRFYFYQANDGQHLYLHSINVRMLQTCYGNLEHAPKTIRGRILQKESFSMVEEFRKRLKYLNHLPITCQFDVVEIEFESRDILTDDIRMKFKDELLQRQKNRQRRAREEHKREKYINRENERRIGKIIHTPVNIDVTSDQQFPICGSFDEAGFPIQCSPTITEPVSISVTTGGRSVPSFAKMLTSPRSESNVENWPTLCPARDVSFSFSDESTMRRPNNSTNPRTMSNDHTDDEIVDDQIDDIEATCAPPEYTASFQSAIAAALSNSNQIKSASKSISVSSNGRNSGGSGGGKKKRNNSKTVLFSTGGCTFDRN